MPEAPPISWAPRDDFEALKAQFAQTGRIQIKHFLDPGQAKHLRSVVSALPWRLVLNENGKHLDIHPLQLAQIPAPKLREIKQAAHARATREFSYLFENYPIYDLLQSGKDIDPALQGVFGMLNSKPFRRWISELTDRPVDYCDLQATRYRAGHFLTTHDDGIVGKNRQMAFVLNLSERWRQSWGGCLEFTDGHGDVIDRILPLFNSLSMFAVPQPHEVTRVKPSAKSSRLALTGWFRLRGEPA